MTLEEWMWSVYTSKGAGPVFGLAGGAMLLSIIRVVFGSLADLPVEHDLPANSKAARYNSRIRRLRPLGAALTGLSIINLVFNVFAYAKVDKDSMLPASETWIVWVVLPLAVVTIGVAIWFAIWDAKAARLKEQVDRARKSKK